MHILVGNKGNTEYKNTKWNIRIYLTYIHIQINIQYYS